MARKLVSTRFNKPKFVELILYIAEHAMSDASFGATKMAKALWLSDFEAYSQLGAPISGAAYKKRQHGPAANEYMPVLEELRQVGEVGIAEQVIAGHSSTRVVALRRADPSVFGAEERAIVDSVINYVMCSTAVAVSDMSHQTRGYLLAEQDETIPYGAALLPDDPEPLSDQELAYGSALGEELFAHS